jgi:stalled ribosome rescue protein Dom34
MIKKSETMQEIPQLGIWMDHAKANLIECGEVSASVKTIHSTFDQEKFTMAKSKGDHLMHNKRQQHLAAYYKKIGNEMSGYKTAILFGPTEAKYELLNILKSDTRFENTTIAVHATDKMTDNQKQAFVNNYFA